MADCRLIFECGIFAEFSAEIGRAQECGGSLLGFVLREMFHTDATCGRRGFKL
jgi:hypothetical protein